MPYAVSPALPGDIPSLATIQWAALRGNPLIQTLYPRGPTPALTAFTKHSYQKAIQFPSVRLIKAIDESTGQIVAFAKWILYPEERNSLIDLSDYRKSKDSNGGWNGEEMQPTPQEVETRALNAWNRVISKTRKAVMANKKHTCRAQAECNLECYFASIAPALWVLDIVHTHPSYQGRKAATQLLKWGIDLADKMRIPCYVESSPAGYPLFQNHDFVDLQEMEIDLNRYRKNSHGHYKYRHVVMIRMPDKPPTVPPKDGLLAVQTYDDKTYGQLDESSSTGSGRLGQRISGKASLIDIKRSPRLDQQSISTGSVSLPSLTRRSGEVSSPENSADRPSS